MTTYDASAARREVLLSFACYLDEQAAACRAAAAMWIAEERRLADKAAALRLEVADERRNGGAA